MSVPFAEEGKSGTAGQQQQDEIPQEVHQNIAGRLVRALEDAQGQLGVLLAEEERLVRQAEGEARAVEASKKSLLNQVRVALSDGTSQRIREIEDAIGNALASIVGVEQHLNQSNGRVTRGRVVSLLLRYFQMFSHINQTTFEGMLASLSRARAEQRARTTELWASGEVSSVDPKYYTTLTRGGGGDASHNPDSNSRKKKRKSHKRQKNDDESEDTDDEESNESSEDDDRSHRNANDRNSDDDGDLPSPENATVASTKIPLHRFEMVAVTQGLDRLFALRYYTEAQVPWVLKLSVLSRELEAVASNASNIQRYLEWLKEELEDDCTHLMDAFRSFYDDSPDAAMHLPYGKSLLKTLELSGKLYGALCAASTPQGQSGPTSDDATALLNYVIDKSSKDLAAEVARVHTPKALPEQPPLPELTMSTLMSFFERDTKPAIAALYEFLEQRIKREALVVESVVSGCFGRSEHAERGGGGTTHSAHARTLSGGDGVVDPHRRTLSGSLTTIAAASASSRQQRSSYVHGSGTASAGGAVMDAGGRQARQQLLHKITQLVIRRYVTDHATSANKQLKTLLAQEGALTPRSKRRSAGRVADAMAFASSVTAELYALCEKLFSFLDEEFGATTDLQIVFDVVPSLFPLQEAYVSERHEVNLLKRYMLSIEESYMRSLLVPAATEDSFDVVPEHSKKAQEFLERIEEVCLRVITLAPPADVPPYIHDLLSLGIETVAAYLIAEGEKMLRCLKDERSAWNKKPSSQARGEEAWINPSPRERQLCAARMILFAQTTVMRLHEYCASIAIQAQLGGLVGETLLDFSSRDDFCKLDDVLEDLLNLVAAAVVSKSLVILYYAQDKHDFQPKDETKKRGGATQLEQPMLAVRPSTRACGLFCQYVSFQLRHLVPLFATSCGQMWRQTIDSDPTYGTVSNPQAPLGGPSTPSTAPSLAVDHVGGDIDRSLTSLRSKSDAVAKVKKMTLQQLVFGDGGPTSLVRSIGVPLYRGLAAHLRGMRCNEAGSLVYKQDVSEYARALLPLMEAPGVDGLIMGRLMSLLKETSGLLMAAVENIRAVKASGLIGELMSNEEKVMYLRMRDDLREGFSRGW